MADRTDRGLSVEDGRYHRLLIEIVYNVEFAIVLVSELQTNIFGHPSLNRKYCWEGIKNATFITYQQGRIKIRKSHIPKQALQSYVSCSDRLLEKQ